MARPKLTPEQGTALCELYLSGQSSIRIAPAFSLSSGSVRDILARHGITRRPKFTYPLTPEQEQELCRLYKAGRSTIYLESQFPVTAGGIRKILHRHGIQLRTRSVARTRYSHNKDFFTEIDSEAPAYWLGFLMADGYVYNDPKGQASLVVNLKTSDAGHLEKLAAALAATHPIIPGQAPGHNSVVRLSIRSAKLCADLARYGVAPCKSATIRFPDLRPDLYPHFIRGYVDGDGGIYIFQDKNGTWMHSFSVTSNLAFLAGLQGHLIHACDLHMTKIDGHSFKSAGYGKLSYSGRPQVARIAHYLYDNATIYLDRKHQVIQQLLTIPPDELNRNPNAHLTEADVLSIRELHEAGMNGPSLAKHFNVSKSTISRVIRRECWKHV